MKSYLMAAFTDKKLIKIKSEPLTPGLLSDGSVQIVDIRTPAEWKDTGLEDTVKVVFIDEFGEVNPNFLKEFDEATDSSKTKALLCRSGYRTYFCARFLTIAGRKNIVNLSGGIVEYMAKFKS